MTKLKLYRKFTDQTQAEDFVSQLNTHGIRSKTIVSNSSPIGSSFGSYSAFEKSFEIHIQESDLEGCNKLLKEQALDTIKDVNSDHYLFDFTNEELIDVLANPEEWNEFDVQLSAKLLKEKAHELTGSSTKENVSEKTAIKLQANTIELLLKAGYKITYTTPTTLVLRKSKQLETILRSLPLTILIGLGTVYYVSWDREFIELIIPILSLSVFPFIFIIAIIDQFIWRLKITPEGIQKIGISTNIKMIENFHISISKVVSLSTKTTLESDRKNFHYIYAELSTSRKKELIKIQDYTKTLTPEQLDQLKYEINSILKV